MTTGEKIDFIVNSLAYLEECLTDRSAWGHRCYVSGLLTACHIDRTVDYATITRLQNELEVRYNAVTEKLKEKQDV